VSKRRASAPEREREIGQRVREARERVELSQPEFAGKIGIRRERLASYELGRVALRHDVALEICRIFNLNIHWLATGDGPFFPFGVVDLEPHQKEIRYKAPLSEAYDAVLSKVFPKPTGIWQRQGPPVTDADEDLKQFKVWFSYCYGKLPPEVRRDFIAQVEGTTTELLYKTQANVEQKTFVRRRKRNGSF
jgi:transcriptional regulator with XRE-family HTH domain